MNRAVYQPPGAGREETVSALDAGRDVCDQARAFSPPLMDRMKNSGFGAWIGWRSSDGGV